ncbi:MAG: hypothetical protein Q7J10_10230 [Methanosarcinaceae archaeon]|nr:hypothetical protein [Methanosarcinaceae archaeon]
MIIKENWNRIVSDLSHIEYANIRLDEQDLQDGASHLYPVDPVNPVNPVH